MLTTAMRLTARNVLIVTVTSTHLHKSEFILLRSWCKPANCEVFMWFEGYSMCNLRTLVSYELVHLRELSMLIITTTRLTARSMLAVTITCFIAEKLIVNVFIDLL